MNTKIEFLTLRHWNDGRYSASTFRPAGIHCKLVRTHFYSPISLASAGRAGKAITHMESMWAIALGDHVTVEGFRSPAETR